jgi:hypothetical protein
LISFYRIQEFSKDSAAYRKKLPELQKIFEGFYSIFVIIRKFLLVNKGRCMDKALFMNNDKNTYWRKSHPRSAVPVGGIIGPVPKN